jgi:hypothetical protein
MLLLIINKRKNTLQRRSCFMPSFAFAACLRVITHLYPFIHLSLTFSFIILMIYHSLIDHYASLAFYLFGGFTKMATRKVLVAKLHSRIHITRTIGVNFSSSYLLAPLGFTFLKEKKLFSFSAQQFIAMPQFVHP